MNPVRRVAVATDFSAGSDAAVDAALRLAQAHGACVDLLHAFDVGAWHGLKAVFDARRLAGETAPDVELRDRLSAHAASLAERSGLEVNAVFGVGEPARAIAAHLQATRAAALVIGRRADPAARGVGGTLLKVLHAAPCPVLVVRPGHAADWRRVLSAVDLRDVSERAAAVAVALFPAAEHRLLYALDPAWEREVWRHGGVQRELRVELESLRDGAARRLDALAQRLSAHARQPVGAEVVDAIPSRAIVERAAAWPADCVAVGRHGEGLLAERLLGSTALDAVLHTAGDVLVVS